MDRRIFLLLIAIVLFGSNPVFCVEMPDTPIVQMEKLTRGLIVVPSENGGKLVSWRMLGTDPLNISFDVLKNGETIALNIKNRTNYIDPSGTDGDSYQIVVKVGGVVIETTDAVTSWGNVYKTIRLDRPSGGTDNVSSETYTYTPNDMSVGDMDGDGEYELIVKWEPSNSTTNANEAKHPGIEYIDCYRLDGTKLWRIDMGPNMLAGSHHTQILVYDFDADGCAEIMLRTAPGTRDGKGNYVNSVADDAEVKNADNTKDWRASGSAAIQGGQEYLTIFKGNTGEAIHTIFYNPNRDGGYGGAATGREMNWDDRSNRNDYVATYGNRGNRFFAAVAYLDGEDKLPSAVMCRGCYTQAYLWAVDFKDNKLVHKWLHASVSKTNVERTNANWQKETRVYSNNTFNDSRGYNTAYGQGNHNLSVADVDGDGCDEIVFGAATIDNDGWLLYSTGLGHGDAMHVADMIPNRPGYEVLRCMESEPYGIAMYDAKTGEPVFYQPAGKDTGRALAANISSKYKGYEFWGGQGNAPRESESGEFATYTTSTPSMNFRIYWDGDLLDELFDGSFNTTDNRAYPNIQKWNGTGYDKIEINYNGSQSCNHTKATPNLQADILGDWREELILWNYDNPAEINIIVSNAPSNFRVPTLMHDHNYRLAIAWQNCAYNQPPHLGYYLPDADFSYPQNDNYTVVWSNEFEDAATLTSGWSVPNMAATQKLLSDGTYALLLDQNAGGGDRPFSYSFTDKQFAQATEYVFEFDWAVKPSNQNNSSISLLGDNSEVLFQLVNVGYAGTSTIYAADGTTVLGTISNNTRDNFDAGLIVNHFIIKGNSDGVTLTVTQGDDVQPVSDVLLVDNFTHLTGISGVLGRAFSHMVLDNFTLSVPEEQNVLVVTDGEDFTAAGIYASAVYERLFNVNYNYGTICLPFAPDAATCANYRFYKLDQYNATTLVFVEETEPKANTAYLYCLKDGVEAAEAKTFTGGPTIVSHDINISEGDWEFIGAFSKHTIFSNGKCYVYAPDKGNGESLSVVNGILTMKPYRAYFRYTGTTISDMATMRMVIKGQGSDVTCIKEINPEEIEGLTAPIIYDLMGRRVYEMQKGNVYIINNQKVLY